MSSDAAKLKFIALFRGGLIALNACRECFDKSRSFDTELCLLLLPVPGLTWVLHDYCQSPITLFQLNRLLIRGFTLSLTQS